MKISNTKHVGWALLLFFAVARSAPAWDSTGHMLVAQIAREQLTDKARARVDELAAQLKKNDVPYNGVNLACWPDDIRARDADTPLRGKFLPWHYISLGCESTDPDELAHPPALTRTNGNVVVALAHCVELIKTKQTDALVPSEAVALALVMHLVGDIHQPLHTTTRFNPNSGHHDFHKNDAGGNAVTVTNLLQTPWSKNLHIFWDEAYRRHFDASSGTVLADPPIDEADAPGSPALKHWLAILQPTTPTNLDLQTDFAKWALEGHAIACRQVYGELGEPYGATNITLPADYVAHAAQTARQQIILAGYRLAHLLNDLYGH